VFSCGYIKVAVFLFGDMVPIEFILTPWYSFCRDQCGPAVEVVWGSIAFPEGIFVSFGELAVEGVQEPFDGVSPNGHAVFVVLGFEWIELSDKSRKEVSHLEDKQLFDCSHFPGFDGVAERLSSQVRTELTSWVDCTAVAPIGVDRSRG
tara:strand:- start:310 stop:756 length:447 start_codon:yes stop_codon:yes gene_type:complete